MVAKAKQKGVKVAMPDEHTVELFDPEQCDRLLDDIEDRLEALNRVKAKVLAAKVELRKDR
jgi:hypothetical protein